MAKAIPAIYENGVLRPLVPVNLSEHQTVWLQVLP
ncbi:MAG: antitoxin family protein [Rhizonema sp. PD38]|nr:antitoxin family protein [Rhizonema sp. PD38]